MQKEKPSNQNKSSKYSYTIISDYFLEEWTEVLGTGPSMLYIHLLKYCYKGKDLAWPTLATLSKKMQLTPKTITKHHQVLTKYGLIKKIIKRKTSPGGHMRNIYQLTPFDMEKNTLPIGNIFPYIEEKITPDIGKKLPTNNNNLNNTNTTTNTEKDAAVVVNFKKLKEKGEEKTQAIREQLIDSDFKESFIEKILKVYSIKKIEEKLELLMIKTNIQNPAGWLLASLKYDYQDAEKESQEEESVGQGGTQVILSATLSSGNKKTLPKEGMKEAASREKALEMIRKTREMLDNL